MNILWFNWKDIKHPEAGGAEVFTHEIAKRLVKNGFNVTLFSSKYDGCKEEEFIDGIRIFRSGNKYSVYREAKRFYNKYSYQFDLIIDEVNTKPFLTPKFVDKPIIALIHQLAREYWFYETRFPINVIGYYLLEKHWLKHYIDIPTIVPSNSTKEDLLRLGFKHLYLVPEGLSIKPLDDLPEKEQKPTLLFVSRLKKVKRPLDAIKAFKIVKEKIKDAQLWIVGNGYMLDDLKRYEDDSIKVFGKVDYDKKIELMKRAHILLCPYVREGWGLVVTEANALGTIAIGYDVNGLRDAIIDNHTGKLVRFGDINTMAKVSIELLNDDNERNRLTYNALRFAKQFSWDNSAEEFISIIENAFAKN